jgi:hypothetical protein
VQLPGEGSDHSCWRSRCDAQRQSQWHTRSQHTLQRARNPHFRRGCRAARCRGARTQTTRHPRAHLARGRAATLHGTSLGHLEATLQVPACTWSCHNRSHGRAFQSGARRIPLGHSVSVRRGRRSGAALLEHGSEHWAESNDCCTASHSKDLPNSDLCDALCRLLFSGKQNLAAGKGRTGQVVLPRCGTHPAAEDLFLPPSVREARMLWDGPSRPRPEPACAFRSGLSY